MSKKLYEIKILGYAYTENEQEAEELAGNLDATTGTVRVYETNSVDNEWIDVVPFGNDDNDNRTCEEILKEIKERA